MFEDAKRTYYDYDDLLKILRRDPHLENDLAEFKNLIRSCVDHNGGLIYLPYGDILDGKYNECYNESVIRVCRFLKDHIGENPICFWW